MVIFWKMVWLHPDENEKVNINIIIIIIIIIKVGIALSVRWPQVLKLIERRERENS